MTAALPVSRADSDRLRPPPLDLPQRVALFLDLDGTLAPIMPRPDDVGPDPARARLLVRLREALEDRVAVVSGRSLPACSPCTRGTTSPLPIKRTPEVVPTS